MKFVLVKDLDELSEAFKQQMLKYMYSSRNRVNIAITTGTTPVKGYKMLSEFVKGKDCFDGVHYYIFDEFWYKDDPVGICRRSLDVKYFKDAGVREECIHNLEEDTWREADAQIQRDGGLDMVVMGIGTNGHFCGNQPGTFENWNEGVHTIDRHRTRVVEELLIQLLHEELHSDDESRIPDHYITMGPRTVMNARSIVFILSGKDKAETARRAFFEPISKDFPVSIFQLHPDVTVIIDEDAAALIKYKISQNPV